MENVGIDIVHLKRIRLKESFIDLVLTAEEKTEYCRLTNDDARISYLGGRFAAKEAAFKATQNREYLALSVLNDSSGKPYILNHPELAISISHDGDYAIAIVLERG